MFERFDEADTARQEATAEKKSRVEDKLVQAQNMRNVSLETSGKEKKIMQVKVRKKDLVDEYPMITSYIFLRSMKGKFHYTKKN